MPTPLVARRSSRAETCSPDLAKCEMRCGAVPCSAVPGCNPGWAASVGTLTQVSTYLASRCSCTSSQRKVDRPASSPPSRQALNFVASPACKTNIAHCLSVDPFFGCIAPPLGLLMRHPPAVSCHLDPTATLDLSIVCRESAGQHDSMTAL